MGFNATSYSIKLPFYGLTWLLFLLGRCIFKLKNFILTFSYHFNLKMYLIIKIEPLRSWNRKPLNFQLEHVLIWSERYDRLFAKSKHLGVSAFEQNHTSGGSMSRHSRFSSFKRTSGSHFGDRSGSKCNYQKQPNSNNPV